MTADRHIASSRAAHVRLARVPPPWVGAGSLEECYAAEMRERRLDRANVVTELEQIA
jgi:hypothetical protein